MTVKKKKSNEELLGEWLVIYLEELMKIRHRLGWILFFVILIFIGVLFI